MLATNLLSDTTLRRPRTLFTIGIFTLCLTLFLSYERLKVSAFGPFQEFLEPTDEPQIPGDSTTVTVTETEQAVYKFLLENIGSTSYGTAARPPLKGMPEMLVDTLPEEFVPAVYSGEGTSADGGRGTARRLVIIGDVHGQTKALEDLLEKVQFNNTKGDHLIFTGDLINKGPDSAGVVAMAMRLGAHSVRGNHEDRVLLAHAAMNKKSPATAAESDAMAIAFDKFQIKEGQDDEVDPASALTAHQVAEAALSKGDQRDRETARSLSDEQIRWLAERPLILHIGPIPRGGGGGGNGQPPTFENMVVVHAGLVPNVSLEAQDPWAVMNMRTITYPVDELRRDAVRAYLVEKAKRVGASAGGARGAMAALQALDDAQVDEELKKMTVSQGLEDRSGDAALPSSGREGTYWYEEWSRCQERLLKRRNKDEKKKEKKKAGKNKKGEESEPITTVVYGHDAKSGLQVPKEFGKGKRGYTFGLDSGCVYGKSLTALVIEVKDGAAVYEIVQVDCEAAAAVDAVAK